MNPVMTRGMSCWPRATCRRAYGALCPLLTAGHTVRECTGPDTDRSQVAEVAGADSKGAAGSVAAVQVEKSTVVGTLCDCSMDSVMTALCKFTLCRLVLMTIGIVLCRLRSRFVHCHRCERSVDAVICVDSRRGNVEFRLHTQSVNHSTDCVLILTCCHTGSHHQHRVGYISCGAVDLG